MARQSSFGICELCGVRKGKAAMVSHLKECLPVSAKNRPVAPVMLLRVQPASGSVFWLNVAARFDARLEQLDGLLRGVWLECCGHMSEFFGSGRREVGMKSRMTEVFGSIGDRINYEYDFGSTTELTLSLAGISEGAIMKPLVAGRNEPPAWGCDECGQPAISICGGCGWSGASFCCAKHGRDHECGEEMLLPVVNSPRMGVCGYTGPD